VTQRVVQITGYPLLFLIFDQTGNFLMSRMQLFRSSFDRKFPRMMTGITVITNAEGRALIISDSFRPRPL
jgi:hypothetical protein